MQGQKLTMAIHIYKVEAGFIAIVNYQNPN